MTASQIAIDFAKFVSKVADEKLAEDIVSFDVSDIVGICEVFIVATARNVRQVKAVAEEIVEQAKNNSGRRPISVEGLEDKLWVLLDFGDVVFHIFTPEQRKRYRLERLYDDAPVL